MRGGLHLPSQVRAQKKKEQQQAAPWGPLRIRTSIPAETLVLVIKFFCTKGFRRRSPFCIISADTKPLRNTKPLRGSNTVRGKALITINRVDGKIQSLSLCKCRARPIRLCWRLHLLFAHRSSVILLLSGGGARRGGRSGGGEEEARCQASRAGACLHPRQETYCRQNRAIVDPGSGRKTRRYGIAENCY